MASSAKPSGGGGAPSGKSGSEAASRGKIHQTCPSAKPWEWKCVKPGAGQQNKDLHEPGKQDFKGLGCSSTSSSSSAKSPDEGGKARSCWDKLENENKEQQNSSALGLKLGKRTYFEDGQPEADTTTNSNMTKSSAHLNQTTSTTGTAAVAASNTTTTTISAPTTPAKKGRGCSQNTVTPKCQVEGCKADLSGSKDYHRRHKVCEHHSKTPRCIVLGQEQRFCQQCSRFHLLAEFDEGKRSCRRRLAGHNERRRKPQPDALAAYSMGNLSSFQAAYQRLGVGSSIIVDSHGDPLGYSGTSWGRLGSHQQFLSKQLVENMSAEKLLLLLQNSKRPTGLPTVSTSTTTTSTTATTAATSNIQDHMKLTLSSSSGGGSGGGGGLSPATESSRALSLLSSEWTKSPSYELSSSSSQAGTNNPQYMLTGSTSPVDSKKVHQQQHHRNQMVHNQAQDAIPISSSAGSSKQQQQNYASSMGMSERFANQSVLIPRPCLQVAGNSQAAQRVTENDPQVPEQRPHQEQEHPEHKEARLHHLYYNNGS